MKKNAAAVGLAGLALSFPAIAGGQEREDCSAAGLGECKTRAKPATEEVEDVSSLRVPSAPALEILTGPRTQGERPAIPAGFSTSVTSSGDISAELAPFWQFFGAEETVQKVLERGFLEALWKDAAVSLAAGDRDLEEMETELAVPSLALGAKTTVFPGRASETARRCHEVLQATLRRRARTHATEIQDLMDQWHATHPRPKIAYPPEPRVIDDILLEELEREFPDRDAATLRAWRDRLLVSPPPFDLAESDEENERLAAVQKRSGEIARQESAAWREERARLREEVKEETLVWERERDAYFARITAAAELPPLPARFKRCQLEVYAREGLLGAVAGAVLFGFRDGVEGADDSFEVLGAGWLTAGYAWISEKGFGTSVMAVGRLRGGDGVEDLEKTAGGRLVLQGKRWGVAPEYTHEIGGDHRRVGLGLDYQFETGIWLNLDLGYAWGEPEEESPWSALTSLQWDLNLERGTRPDTTPFK